MEINKIIENFIEGIRNKIENAYKDMETWFDDPKSKDKWDNDIDEDIKKASKLKDEMKKKGLDKKEKEIQKELDKMNKNKNEINKEFENKKKNKNKNNINKNKDNNNKNKNNTTTNTNNNTNTNNKNNNKITNNTNKKNISNTKIENSEKSIPVDNSKDISNTNNTNDIPVMASNDTVSDIVNIINNTNDTISSNDNNYNVAPVQKSINPDNSSKEVTKESKGVNLYYLSSVVGIFVFLICLTLFIMKRRNTKRHRGISSTEVTESNIDISSSYINIDKYSRILEFSQDNSSIHENSINNSNSGSMVSNINMMDQGNIRENDNTVDVSNNSHQYQKQDQDHDQDQSYQDYNDPNAYVSELLKSQIQNPYQSTSYNASYSASYNNQISSSPYGTSYGSSNNISTSYESKSLSRFPYAQSGEYTPIFNVINQ